MILGKITGKVSTTKFYFEVINPKTRKFQFVQIYHQEYGFVLCQIIELIRTKENMIAKCNIIGYKDGDNKLKNIRTPFHLNTEVLNAKDKFIKKIIELNTNSAYIGYLEGRQIPVHIDLQKLLTKHVSILAKSGAGKSYTVGVLIEEIIEKGIPLLIIDPHGEYSSLKKPSEEKKEKLAYWKISAKEFSKQILEYGDINENSNLIPLKLNENINSYELIKYFPTQLSSTQESILFSAMKNLETNSFDNIILELESMNIGNNWQLIDTLKYLKSLKLFSSHPTPLLELIKPNQASILNLKGIDPSIQNMVVAKLLKDLFLARKKEKIPPFFCVIEEAHNFVPEKGFGKSKSSEVIRLISSEGRKFGLGLCIVSQRPALVQKTVLAQCTTQIIMKITNPNDLRTITNSIEGISSETVDEIQNLSIGSALVCGVVDKPLLVNIRNRKTKHGGESVDILGDYNAPISNKKTTKIEQEKYFCDELGKYSDGDILPIIEPKLNLKEIELISEKTIKNITTYLIPSLYCICEMSSSPGDEFIVLVEKVLGKIIIDPDEDIKTEISNVDPKNSFFRKIKFKKVKYDQMIPQNLDNQNIINKLKKHCNVKDFKECYIMFNKIEY